MSGKFYFMYLNSETRSIPNSAVEAALGEADWARLRGGTFYLVYSDKTAQQIKNMVRPVLDTRDHILVGEFDKGNRSGWLSTTTIDWITKDRS